MVNPCFVVEGLMPGDKRRGMPAVGAERRGVGQRDAEGLFVNCEDRQQVGKEGHVAPLSPTSLLLGELHEDVELNGNRLARLHRLWKGHNEGGLGISLVAKWQFRR